MKQRNVPRSNWSIKCTKAGKPYIDAPKEDKHLGYNIAHNGSLVAMAFSLGRKHKVWNIGVDVVKMALPRGIDFDTYVDSRRHKLTALEASYLDIPDEDGTSTLEQRQERALNRLFVIWTIKEAYIKALGQPPGFDFSRVECRIPEEEIYVDNKRLTGWEFRLFKANIGVQRTHNSTFREYRGYISPGEKPEIVREIYQCCMAIYRGSELATCRFKWSTESQELEKFLRFVTLDAMVNAAKHISADGLNRDREIAREPSIYERGDKSTAGAEVTRSRSYRETAQT